MEIYCIYPEIPYNMGNRDNIGVNRVCFKFDAYVNVFMKFLYVFVLSILIHVFLFIVKFNEKFRR